MHSIEELGTNVPAFLAKLWKIVEDPETNDLICWNPGGTSFFIRNQARFARELLPLYYKHNNMASFVRQLNMYGFHKVTSIEGNGYKMDKDEMEFAHQCFLMGHPYLLGHIKRKIPTSKVEEGRTGLKPDFVNKVLADVKIMKGRQDSVDTQLNAMKRENEVLWREVAILRQKHLKQQQIVNKLIQFLVSMVQSSRNGGIGIKRHYPLMLNDTSHHPSKVSKLSTDLSDLSTAPNTMSPTGPVIHELDAADLLEECEPNTETPAEENFIPADFVEVTEPSPSPSSNRATSASPDPNIGNANPEAVLEFVEECPLSPSMLLTASPMEVMAPRLNKGKLRTRVKSTDKRKSKKIMRKNIDDSSSLQMGPENSEEDLGVNDVDLLNVVLPALVDDETEELEPETSERSSEVQNSGGVTASESLAAVTNAAISAMNNAAAASKTNSLQSILVSSDKNISKPAMSGNMLVINSPSKASVATSSGKGAKRFSKSNPSYNLLVKQEPSEQSPSHDEQIDPSNMALACTGNNAEDVFGRCNMVEDLDNRVDTLQTELDALRDILKGEGCSLDANTLLGVCAAIPALEQDFLKLFSDDHILPELPNATFENMTEDQEKEATSTTGNELATYSSNLFDMVDMFDEPGSGDWSAPVNPESNTKDVSLSELNSPQMAVVCPSVVSKKK